jgi:gliding motility-associated-like protein
VVQDLTPQFTLTGDLEICPQETTTITVVPTNSDFDVNSVGIQWTFNGDVIVGATGSSLVIVGTSGYGLYTVTVNNAGCTSTQTFEIIESTDEWDVIFNGTPDLCPDETGTLTATVANNTNNSPVTYNFTLPNGSQVENSTGILNIDETGVYEVVVDILGCTTQQTFEVVESTDSWDITFTGTASLCPDESGTLTAVVTNNTNNSPVNYTFTLPNGSQVENNTGVLNIDDVGVYEVVVEILGCTSTQTFTVSPSNTQWNVSFTGPLTLCPTEPGTLTAVVTNNTNNSPVTYTYTLPNGTELVSGSNVLPTSGAGVYTVVVDILGCQSAPVSFTVGASVSNWQVAFTGTPYVICAGETVELVFTATNFNIDNANAVYTWTSPSGTTGVGKTFTANQIGTYTLSVNIFGCISTFPVEVAANDLAIAIDFTQGCLNNAYRLVAEPFNGSFDVVSSSFTWSGPNVIATNEDNVIILGANGTYSVTVTNTEGCSATETITVDNISCTIQRGITPNNDGKNDFFDLSALNVRELFIYNRYGTQVYRYGNYTNQWNGQSNAGDELPDGTYFYMIQTVEGESITGWIFINR